MSVNEPSRPESSPLGSESRYNAPEPAQTLLALHQKRLRQYLKANQQPSFPILDTCRLDNGGILPQGWPHHQKPSITPEGFVAFIPAAGAASRYFKPFAALAAAVSEGDKLAAARALETVQAQAATMVLPPDLARLLAATKAPATLTEADLAALRSALERPKALMPCVAEGETFLEMKLREHQALGRLEGQVFVAGSGLCPLFAEEFARLETRLAKADRHQTNGAHEAAASATCMEQGPGLSTIRFRKDAEPYLDVKGRTSLVPAGHGALVKLFPPIKRRFPKAHSLFIRNIDNVMGTGHEALSATRAFLGGHVALLNVMNRVREALRRNEVNRAADEAEELLRWTPLSARLLAQGEEFLTEQDDEALKLLWDVQMRLFFSYPRAGATGVEELKRLYARPVNSMGQVPNTGRDVGGTPVIVSMDQRLLKVCLEVPHATPADKSAFLANPRKATHFNPVFVAAELTQDAAMYEDPSSPFWLIAAKSYHGQDVYYHETLLYELLGNSLMANVVFVEVPRSVFHPHKSVEDIAGRHLSDWQDHPER